MMNGSRSESPTELCPDIAYPPKSLALEANPEPLPASLRDTQPIVGVLSGTEEIKPGVTAKPEQYAFAKLVPTNDSAKRAFHELALAQKDGKLKPHHNDFITFDETSTKLTLTTHDDTSESITTDSENDAASQSTIGGETTMMQGHFEFSFHVTTGCITSSGYRIGKGSSKVLHDRNVDILVVPPLEERISNSTQRAAKSILSTHSLIQVHPVSGVLMLAAVSRSRPVKYQDADEEDLFSPQKHVLYRKKNNFWLGDLQYCFEYLVTPDKYGHYVQQRNAYLQQYYPGRSPPHKAISAVPQDGDNRVDIAFIYKTINSGAFGVVWAGVHKLTGAPLAIKELCIKDRRHVKTVTEEVDIARRFQDVSCSYADS